MRNDDVIETTFINSLDKLNGDNLPNPVNEEYSPIDEVESSLSKFVTDLFEVVKKENSLNDSLQEELVSRLSQMSIPELITLHQNTVSLQNDKISKILSPTFGIISAKQQAKIAAANKQQSTVNIMNNLSSIGKNFAMSAPAEAVQGITILNRLLSSAQEIEAQAEDKNDENNQGLN